MPGKPEFGHFDEATFTALVSEFVAGRPARDRRLAMPVLVLPTVQVNIRAGLRPPPESSGTIRLKIPLNAF